MLLGEEGRRRLENRSKTNDQLFGDYYDLIANTHSPKSLYGAKRILEKFKVHLGQYPPIVELAVQFLGQFRDRKPNTRALSVCHKCIIQMV